MRGEEKAVMMNGTNAEEMKITILGARGSTPTSGKETMEYGGATSCLLVQAGGKSVFLDAGNGIMNAPDIPDDPVCVFFTHLHLDHVLGLPYIPHLYDKGHHVDLYARKQEGSTLREQIEKIYTPPGWPCGLDVYPAGVMTHDEQFPVMIGEIKIEAIESVHPGESTVYRVSYHGKSIVYATDYEYDETTEDALIDFSKNAEILFFDGQYTEEEYQTRRGYGHSTVSHGLTVMEKAHVKRLKIVHHDPRHTDRFLKEWEDKVKTERISFAREGEIILL